MSTYLESPGLRVAVLVLITAVVYIPAMGAGFIWDDDLFLTENPLIKADDGLYRFWFTTQAPDYFPLVSSSLWLEWRLWGMNATGYHVVNVLLHAISSVLIWLVLRRLSIPGAWLAALVFAIHPVNVESVAWITERKNTQPMVFYLLTILSYLKFQADGRNKWYLLAMCAYLLALLSKTSVVMLPFVLLGCAWWQQGRMTKRDLVRSIAFFVLSGVLGLVTVWFQYNVAIGEDTFRTAGFFARLAGAGWAVWFYIYKAILPLNLSFVYPQWQIEAASILSYLPALLIAVCLGLLWRYRKSWGRGPLFGLGYFMVTLFPVLGFFDINFMRYTLVTDHWQYTSIIGIIALVVGLGTAIVANQPQLKKMATVVGVAIVGVLSVLSWGECHKYKDVEALWRDTVSKNPKAWVAHNNLGTALLAKEKFEEAAVHCFQALRMNPGHAKVHCALGTALAGVGRLEEAVTHLSNGLALNPNLADAHYDVGRALSALGRLEEAVEHFSEALRLAPGLGQAHADLGIALAQKGRLDEAMEHFAQAAQIEPAFAGAHYNLGLALVGQGRIKEAVAAFSRAVAVDPQFAEAYYNLGAVLASAGRLDEAIGHFSRAVEIRPDFREAKQGLKRAMGELGKRGQASGQ
ncbi:MAG: tetratricopeptide repeat protein [Thermodesulfobacteriota bacterium]|nr:tetratricopeptide repeat protein [Thermodesulfobacteriota bacterium]